MSIHGMVYWPFLFFVLIAANQASADIVRQYESPKRPNEIDTADQGGQIGGLHLGRGYKLINLRCAPGEAIVGLETRRGSVLDYVRINCARPVCDSRGCQWSSQHSGAASGSPGGGNSQPPMMCAPNEVVSGIRGRSVTFTVFDYAADIQIECSPIAAPPTAEGFIALRQAGGGGGYGFGSASEGSRGLGRSAPAGGGTVASCSGSGFGATAVAVGESDFVRRGQRVVQAVSLLCPDGKKAPDTSDTVKMIDTMDRCFRFGVPPFSPPVTYYASPNRQVYSGTVGYQNSTVLYNPSHLARQEPFLRAVFLARSFAAHVLSLLEQTHGDRLSAESVILASDEITGLLVSCLVKYNVLPDEDPRGWFAMYLSREAPGARGNPSLAADRKDFFFRGYSWKTLDIQVSKRKPGE